MGKKIYIGNLAFSSTDNSLNDLFSQYGTVDSCRIVMDRDTGRSKGFGFVEMSTDDEAEKAISELNGKEIDGRSLRVNEARPQERSSFGGRSKGFGGSGFSRSGGFGGDRSSSRRSY